MDIKTVLTIAGSDCSGGAGIQADLKTFAAHGVYGMSIVTAVVAENTTRVSHVHHIPTDNIAHQFDDVFTDIYPQAVKIGMLANVEIMQLVTEKIKGYAPQNVVLDPVMYAKGGAALMEEDAMDILIKLVVPLADVITPNIPEAEKILGQKIANREWAAKAILERCGCKAVLIKGGHDVSDEDSQDLLYDGQYYFYYSDKRIDTKHIHGTGCTFSSAIAANLAKGMTLDKATKFAKKYITKAIKTAPGLGAGYGPTNHMIDISKLGKRRVSPARERVGTK